MERKETLDSESENMVLDESCESRDEEREEEEWLWLKRNLTIACMVVSLFVTLVSAYFAAHFGSGLLWP